MLGAAALGCSMAHAGTGKLLLTGGISSIDGAAGGGLTPWAVIGTNADATEPPKMDVYQALGLKHVINAIGTVTFLGGSVMPPEVVAAGARPILYSRSAEFVAIWEDVIERLRGVFQTEGEVLVFGASGSGAMDSAVANLAAPGERVLVATGSVAAGWFKGKAPPIDALIIGSIDETHD